MGKFASYFGCYIHNFKIIKLFWIGPKNQISLIEINDNAIKSGSSSLPHQYIIT